MSICSSCGVGANGSEDHYEWCSAQKNLNAAEERGYQRGLAERDAELATAKARIVALGVEGDEMDQKHLDELRERDERVRGLEAALVLHKQRVPGTLRDDYERMAREWYREYHAHWDDTDDVHGLAAEAKLAMAVEALKMIDATDDENSIAAQAMRSVANGALRALGIDPSKEQGK